MTDNLLDRQNGNRLWWLAAIVVAIAIIAPTITWRPQRQPNEFAKPSKNDVRNELQFAPVIKGEDELAPLALDPDRRSDLLEALVNDGVLALGQATENRTRFVQYKDEQDRYVLPVFTSAERAAEYINTLQLTDVSTFSLVEIDPIKLLDDNFALVLNARTEFESPITATDFATMREMRMVVAKPR